ncbi:hypothetical protein ASA1KI_12980 [Opitutales bacterium ASA1]|uniref:hypothetical protein n=1 Tax=Congregicoccus parvus TaxID=3081749 RepID=UPI002B31D87B|nr:hypothetical protein ASA1KI_12980 [Opitutales bacterium ASA1]
MFGAKSKTLFVDMAGPSAYAARTSGLKAPFLVEAVEEIRLDEGTELVDALRRLAGVKGNMPVQAAFSLYPAQRVVAVTTVDPKRFSEENYLSELVRESVKVDASKYSLHLVSPSDGSDVAQAKGPAREALVCGAPTEQLIGLQDDLVEKGCFPLRLEIGTVASLGGLIDYLRATDTKTPTLMLEIGRETTAVFIVGSNGVEISRMVQFGIEAMIPQVQKELALKDEEAARKLFYSNSFDFTGLGAQLTKRLVRELQASIGFYEVQTGLSVNQLCCTLIPSKVAWLEKTLADVLGMRSFAADYETWMTKQEIELAADVRSTVRGNAWMGLFSLMAQYRDAQNEAAA